MFILIPVSGFALAVYLIFVLARGYGRAITSPKASPNAVVISLLIGALAAAQTYHVMNGANAPQQHNARHASFFYPSATNDDDWIAPNPGSVSMIFHNQDVARKYGLRLDSNGNLIK